MNREEAIKVLNSRPYTGEVREVREALETLIPELNENTDERIRKWMVGYFTRIGKSWIHREFTCNQIIAYLEKQKDASKAIEAVDRIDKYIDEHLANAHDMKDSDPDKKYYRGWDDALGKMAGILQDVYSGEKQKESLRDFIDNFPYSAEQKEHQNNSDAPNESSWAGMISSSDKDKNLDEIAQDYVNGVKEYNPEPTWDLIQTAVCYGYHLGANHQVLDNEHLLSAIQVQFASHAKVENGKRYAKLTWDEFKKIIFELYSCEKQKEQKSAEWSEEDEHYFQNLIMAVDSTFGDGNTKNWLQNRLKSLHPQSKIHYWIEEEIEPIISDYLTGKEHYGGMIARLRCLKPKSSWRPSVKQMNTLFSVKGILRNLRYDDKAETIAELYEQLKKHFKSLLI